MIFRWLIDNALWLLLTVVIIFVIYYYSARLFPPWLDTPKKVRFNLTPTIHTYTPQKDIPDTYHCPEPAPAPAEEADDNMSDPGFDQIMIESGSESDLSIV